MIIYILQTPISEDVREFQRKWERKLPMLAQWSHLCKRNQLNEYDRYLLLPFSVCKQYIIENTQTHTLQFVLCFLCIGMTGVE